MSDIILPEVSLCAIVKNELSNKAGSIQEFVEHIVPFLGGAVILDTGSTDGTYKALKELEKKHKQLKIYQHSFEGYDASRNKSLQHVNTDFALILDADERLSTRYAKGEDALTALRNLKTFMMQRQADSYGINSTLLVNGEWLDAPTLNPRIFRTNTGYFHGSPREQIYVLEKNPVVSNLLFMNSNFALLRDSLVEIKHYK